MADARKTTLAYFDAWQIRDMERISVCLHPEVTFLGPLSRLAGRKAVLDSFEPLFPALEELRIRTVFAEDQQTITVYDFVCAEPFGLIRMTELHAFDDGLIKSIELFFDPRPFVSQSNLK